MERARMTSISVNPRSRLILERLQPPAGAVLEPQRPAGGALDFVGARIVEVGAGGGGAIGREIEAARLAGAAVTVEDHCRKPGYDLREVHRGAAHRPGGDAGAPEDDSLA